jgi:putative drug exporter of the RND superfamily
VAGRGKRDGAVIRTARWSAEHPWRAIAGWIALVAVCAVVGGLAGTRSQTDSDEAVGEWGRAEHIVDDGRFADPIMENVLVTAPAGSLDKARGEAALADVARRFRALPDVVATQPVVTAADGSALLLRAELAGPEDTSADRVAPLLDATAAVRAAYPDLRVEEVGDASINRGMSDTLDKDFSRAEQLSVPISLAILVLVFGALLAAGVPVLLALSSVVAAIGLSALVSHVVPASDAISSVILLIGMAVGVDYSLFYVRRAREERARGASTLDAVEIAAATSGRAVVVSGVTVGVAMAGMLLSQSAIFVSLAVGTMLVVAVAVLGSITVLPAVLAKLGRWVDRPRVPFLHRLTMRAGEPRLWPALLRPVLRRPAVALAVSAGLLVALAIPAAGMKTRLLSDDDLPRTIPIVASYDRLTRAFPSQGQTYTVAVEAPAASAGAVRDALLALDQRARANPLFAVTGPADLRESADHRVLTLDVATTHGPESDLARDGLDALRADLVPATVGRVPGAAVAVGGATAASVDFSHLLGRRLPVVIVFVLVLTFALMLWAFRSVVIAATAIVLNLLSVGAAYGLMVLVFQHTWAEGLLHFTSNGAIVAWIPMFLFVVLFGLSMDYHVFVISRIRESAMAGMPTREAIQAGVVRSAGAVTSAAAVMVAVFSIFATLSTLDFKQLGVGLGAAILIDATLVRAVLLPSAMALLGRWNWWMPAPLRPRHRGRHVVGAEPVERLPVESGAR